MKKVGILLPLFLILIIAFLVRFIFLGSVPTAINNDQLHYILNAKSFALTGTDLSSTINIFQVLLFHYPVNELPQAELPFFLIFPFVSFLPLSLTTIALPNVLLSVGIVWMMYLLAKQLFSRKVAVLTAFVAAFNPWFIFTGRTLYEVVPATFFYLCFIYVLLIAKKWKILWSFPLMLLAFYSYIGTKLIFLPIIFLTLIYSHYIVNKKHFLKQYSILFILATLFVGFFLIQIYNGNTSTSRLSEIVTPNNPAVVERVDAVRQAAIQHPFNNLFENKITIYIRLLLENFFHIFSLDYLFLQGDGFFSLERHGLFYVLDLFFLPIGAVVLFMKKRSLFFYLLLLILVSTIPQIIHDPKASGNFTPHITLLFPFMVIFIAVGIDAFINMFPRFYRPGALVATGLLYFFFVANFFHIYFFQLPMRTGLFDYPTRLLAKYAQLAREDNKALAVYSPETTIAFKKYLFYTDSLNKGNINKVKESLKGVTYQVNNVTFLPCNDTTISTASAIIVHDKICGKPTLPQAHGLPQLKDSGSMYLLYNDSVCPDNSLQRFVTGLNLEQLAVESMTKKEFCETYVLTVE